MPIVALSIPSESGWLVPFCTPANCVIFCHELTIHDGAATYAQVSGIGISKHT